MIKTSEVKLWRRLQREFDLPGVVSTGCSAYLSDAPRALHLNLGAGSMSKR